MLIGIASGLSQPTRAQPPISRQITLFGIVASPVDPRIDPKLVPIQDQLRKLLPGHGFQLLSTETKRVAVGETHRISLGDTEFKAGVQLIDWSDAEGKVPLRFALDYQDQTELATIVRTPPNQLFFCDKALPNRMRLLVGIGVR
jgi:hypothetical protein